MCKFNFQEVGRERLGMLSTILNIILCLMGITTICATVYMKMNIEDKITMLGGYNGSAFTDYLIATGTLMLIINGVVAKVTYDCADADTRGPYVDILSLFYVLLGALSIVVMMAAVLCYGHHNVIDHKLSKGFLNAMKKYKSTQTVKKQMDEIQANFACCGGESFVDWFHVSWIHEDYVDRELESVRKNIKNGEYITDDVPFSCCDVTASRPCVHHAVAHSSQHKNRQETLNKEGCNGALKWYFQNRVFAPCGHVAVVAFFLEAMTTFIFRLLQTSIHSAVKHGDPAGDGEAHCCPVSCCNGRVEEENYGTPAPIEGTPAPIDGTPAPIGGTSAPIGLRGGPNDMPDLGGFGRFGGDGGKGKKDKHNDKLDKKDKTGQKSNKQKDVASKNTKQGKPPKSPKGSPTGKKPPKAPKPPKSPKRSSPKAKKPKLKMKR